MPRFAFLLVLACFAGIAAYWFGAERRAERAAGTAPAAAPVQDAYTTGPATPDGTGKFFHGREIAQVMGRSEAAVKSLLARARNHLREQLEPYLKTGQRGP